MVLKLENNDENITKIRALYKALDECNQIIEKLSEENQKLKDACSAIKKIDQECCKDLSKIRGD